MNPTLRRRAVVMALTASCGAAVASSPPPASVAAERPVSPADAYLVELGLIKPLAASLRQRLEGAAGESRRAIAESLGDVYAKMLDAGPTPAERQDLEIRCRELLTKVPEVATPALRLTLATAQYLPMEDLVERHLLLLATPEESAEARRVLSEVTPIFQRLGRELTGRLKTLEERRDRPGMEGDELEKVRAQIEEVREQRSRSEFRAGWASLYMSALTGDRQHAAKAMEHFGVLLNALPGRAATIDRAPIDLIRFDHIAKTVTGCALASSRLGNHVEAMRWMAELDQAADLPPETAGQLLRRRLVVLAADDRWSDMDVAVSKARRDESGKARALAVADARQLAIASLDALRRQDLRDGLRAKAERLAEVAMTDLVTRGEVGHVMSLVRHYGTAIIGSEGFINTYVRAMRAFDDARALHASRRPAATNSPTDDAETVNAYRLAAELFQACLGSADAAVHPATRVQAAICLGLSQHYAGRLEEAATSLEEAFALPGPESDRRHALQYAIVSLGLAAKGGAAANATAIEASRARLETLFIQTFPNTREANAMVLRRAGGGRALSATEIDALLLVPREDPVYRAARSVAADGLYRAWRSSAGGASRDFAGVKFIDVAMDLLRQEVNEATASDVSDEAAARRTADVAMNRARRVAEVALGAAAADVSTAQEAMTIIDSLARFHGVDLAKLADELGYRRFQIAVARRDPQAEARELDALRALGGPFVPAAERFIFRRALDRWRADRDDLEAAASVVAGGTRVLLHADFTPAALAGVRDGVADAAAALWHSRGEVAMRELAMRLDQEQVEKGFKTLGSLRRLATMAEQAGEIDLALRSWLDLLAAAEEDADAWYEARHESIRLLAKGDQAKALAALRQFKALRPGYGPPPWDAKFDALERRLGLATSTPPGGVP
jgi:tetratricopeptide (TPR) repeat protein